MIGAIERFQKVLADKSAAKEDRIEALKFIVHFVGDIHQPLHCADRNGDKGGNKCLAFFLGQRKALNLHTIWDTWILKSVKGSTSIAEYGDALNVKITDKQAKSWSKGGPLQWAAESWKIARETVYVDVPVDAPQLLSEDYIAKAEPIVEERLQQAGVRLATLLNDALK